MLKAGKTSSLFRTSENVSSSVGSGTESSSVCFVTILLVVPVFQLLMSVLMSHTHQVESSSSRKELMATETDEEDHW